MYHDSKIVVLKRAPTPHEIAGFLMLAGLAGGLFFYQHFLAAQARLLKAEVKNRSSSIISCTKDKENLDAYLKQYSSDIEEFKKILFKEKDISMFLDGISALSQKKNVSVLSIRNLAEKKVTIDAKAPPTKAAPAGLAAKEPSFAIVVNPFRVELEGNLEDILDVLAALEASRQLVTISDFSFSIQQKYPRISATFQLDLYGFGDEDQDEAK